VSKKRSSNDASTKYQWVAHIVVDFNDQERKEALDYCDGLRSDFFDQVTCITQMGVAVKVTYDGYNDCYILTLQPKDRTNKYYGYTLGFSHVDLARLMQVGVFIVEVLMEHEAISIPNKGVVADW